MNIFDFKIADVVFRLSTSREIRVNQSFESFQIEGEEPECMISFYENPKIDFEEKTPVFSNISYEVQLLNNSFIRQYREGKKENCLYAKSWISQDGKRENIEYLPGFEYAFSESQNCFSHIAFEELLLKHQRMILHASFVNTKEGGILFSGPSGIGKSTQAKLWRDLEGAEIINGDRTILGKKKGIWNAWGSPYAGSSGCWIAKDFPIKTIIILSQGEESEIQRMDNHVAFRKLFSETTINAWNQQYMTEVIDMMIDLIKTVPIYYMKCKPDKTAVEVVKRVLKREVV